MSFLNNLRDFLNTPKPQAGPGIQFANDGTQELVNDMDKLYSVERLNWYSAKPYGFKMTTRDGGIFTMFLPINPSNLNITTNFATNVVTTLYGTIEEHSDVRYYDITIEGTTGMAPQFVAPGSGDNSAVLYSELKKDGRSAFPISQGISAGGFFSKTLALVNQIKSKATDLIGGQNPDTGIHAESSGYVAFHNLYRFLLQYKKDAAGISSTTDRETHPLTFFNYKDNNQYDVIVRGFVMRRDAANPMLYNYSIQLRGYNLTDISAGIDEDLTKRLKDLGLNGVDSSSILGDIKSISSQVKGIVGSAVGGISVLGR